MVFDRRYYDEQYRDYEAQNPPRKVAFYARLAERAAGGLPRPRVLDVGCAFGRFLASLGDRWQRFGVDASDYAVQRARAKCPDVSFAVYRDGPFPFPVPFDVIAAFDVLEHVHNLRGLMKVIASSLAPGGGFIFVVPVYDGLTGPLIRLLDRDPTHMHKMSRYFWLELGRQEFQLVEWWGICRYLLPGGVYMHVVTRRYRRFTPAIACRLQRL